MGQLEEHKLGFPDAGIGTGISREFPGPVPSRVPEFYRDRDRDQEKIFSS